MSQAPAQVRWFFSVSLLILNGEVCERDIVINVSKLRNDFDMALHRGSFVVLYVCSHLPVRRQVAPPQNVEVENTVKLFFFAKIDFHVLSRIQNLMFLTCLHGSKVRFSKLNFYAARCAGTKYDIL